jgi:D-amino-acid dehydrogenase
MTEAAGSHGTAGLEIVVIGAGIVGACCAAWLVRDGHAVTLLDPGPEERAASWGNAGAISPGSCIPLAMPGVLRKVPGWLLDADGPLVVRPRYALKAAPWLARFVAAGRASRVPAIADALRALHGPVYESYAALIGDDFGDGLIRRSGSLVVYRGEAAFAGAAGEWRMRRERGARFERVQGAELHSLVPALSGAFTHAMLQPDHGYVVDPLRLTRAIIDSARSAGARLHRARAIRLAPGSQRVEVVVEGGEAIAADRVVVAAGAWSRALVEGIGIRIPLETQRGYHLHVRRPAIELPMPVSFAQDKFYATPMAGGIRLAGTVEFAGLASPPDERRASRLSRIAARWLPKLTVEGATPWMGHRPCLPDSLPAIGPVAQDPRIVLAFGHGHNGMTSAPTTGRLVADLVAGRPPRIDAAPYRPDRF